MREILHTLPPSAQEAIRDDLEGTHKYAASEFGDEAAARHRQGQDDGHRQAEDDAPTAGIPVSGDR